MLQSTGHTLHKPHRNIHKGLYNTVHHLPNFCSHHTAMHSAKIV